MSTTAHRLLSTYLSIALRAARAAGSYQLSHFGREQKISYKGKINIVTEIDKQCEKMILKMLRAKYPGHDYVTEETDIAQTGKDCRWIIDPLDGTTNYAHGYPFFCVSIGLEVKGRVRVGVVYAPYLRELFYAVEGQGAWLQTPRAKKRLRVSRVGDMNKALLVTGFPYSVRDDAGTHLALFKKFLLSAQGVRRDGSAALDLCYVAAGRFEGFWELNLHSWDTAAGELIVREAGGKNTDIVGKPYDPSMPAIISSNGLLHRRMLAIVRGMPATRS